jgi:hypothetical protein
VSDLILPEGVEAMVEGERVICSVQSPTVLKATDEGEEGGEPEVIGQESEEDEG